MKVTFEYPKSFMRMTVSAKLLVADDDCFIAHILPNQLAQAHISSLGDWYISDEAIRIDREKLKSVQP